VFLPAARRDGAGAAGAGAEPARRRDAGAARRGPADARPRGVHADRVSARTPDGGAGRALRGRGAAGLHRGEGMDGAVRGVRPDVRAVGQRGRCGRAARPRAAAGARRGARLDEALEGERDVVALSFSAIAERLRQAPLPELDLVVGVARGGVVPASLAAFALQTVLVVVHLTYRDDANR